ncbi:MAG: ABC transporter permease, partial [Alphaproteobacteria bacterium]|nr:ABC transporter permease [Alphaproteobacteria bacterium]
MTARTDRRMDAVAIETPFRRFASDFFESRIATVALAVFAVIAFIALFAPWIAPTDPYDLAQVSVLDSHMPPGAEAFDGRVFWLGTDGAGRDLVSAICYGLRISLGVGVMSGVIAMAIGCAVGLAVAYFGGRVDTLIMRIVDIQLSFPSILVALVLLAVLGKGVDKILIALVTVQWAYYARTVRASALVERSKEYIDAASCLALSHRRILFRHLLPNCMP